MSGVRQGLFYLRFAIHLLSSATRLEQLRLLELADILRQKQTSSKQRASDSEQRTASSRQLTAAQRACKEHAATMQGARDKKQGVVCSVSPSIAAHGSTSIDMQLAARNMQHAAYGVQQKQGTRSMKHM